MFISHEAVISQIPCVYLGTYQTSMIELFAKIINGFEPLTIFGKKFHHRLSKSCCQLPQSQV